MARQRRTHPGQAPERAPAQGRYGPRGGLAGASDDFAAYAQPGREPLGTAWDGWSHAGVYGRGAAHDRVDRGPARAPDRAERIEQDYRDAYDPDFGGRDNAAYYARHGSNQRFMEQRRRETAQRAREAPARGPEIDPDYHLRQGARRPDSPYAAAPRNPAWPGHGRGYGADYGAFGGDYSGEGEDPYRAWPGHDFPGARGLPSRAWGAAPGQPGLAEPSYGSSPTRQAVDHRGLAPQGYRRSDARIREDLCERLTEDPWVDARGIRVACNDGTVQFEGEVADRATRHRVEDIAAVCPGVTGIDNRIRVRPHAVTRAEQRSA